MATPSLDDLARIFTQARDNADGYATSTHAGVAAVVRAINATTIPDCHASSDDIDS